MKKRTEANSLDLEREMASFAKYRLSLRVSALVVTGAAATLLGVITFKNVGIGADVAAYAGLASAVLAIVFTVVFERAKPQYDSSDENHSDDRRNDLDG